MQRDIRLVQQILDYLEQLHYPEFGGERTAPTTQNFQESLDSSSFQYNRMLLAQEGYIELWRPRTDDEQKYMSPIPVSNYRLTWKGHNFLDRLRGNPTYE
jgi:hypothetical protein